MEPFCPYTFHSRQTPGKKPYMPCQLEAVSGDGHAVPLTVPALHCQETWAEVAHVPYPSTVETGGTQLTLHTLCQVKVSREAAAQTAGEKSYPPPRACVRQQQGGSTSSLPALGVEGRSWEGESCKRDSLDLCMNSWVHSLTSPFKAAPAWNWLESARPKL